MKKPFSERYGYQPLETSITVREDAPPVLREALPQIAEQAGLRPSQQREIICKLLLKQPNRNNWSEYPNIWDEVNELVMSCDWWEVYNIAEAFYKELPAYSPVSQKDEVPPHTFFVRKLNEVFLKYGIGWKMTDEGDIELRSDEFSNYAVEQAQQALVERNMPNSLRELHMAKKDLSRLPEPDVTGVVQHSTTALESLVRELTGTTKTLGDAAKDLKDLNIPQVLIEAIRKLYGYASEPRGGGRHGSEYLQIDRAEAQLVFHLCAALIAYLSEKGKGQ